MKIERDRGERKRGHLRRLFAPSHIIAQATSRPYFSPPCAAVDRGLPAADLIMASSDPSQTPNSLPLLSYPHYFVNFCTRIFFNRHFSKNFHRCGAYYFHAVCRSAFRLFIGSFDPHHRGTLNRTGWSARRGQERPSSSFSSDPSHACGGGEEGMGASHLIKIP